MINIERAMSIKKIRDFVHPSLNGEKKSFHTMLIGLKKTKVHLRIKYQQLFLSNVLDMKAVMNAHLLFH